MSKIILLLFMLCRCVAANAQTSLDGAAINLSGFAGKKLLYVVMPVNTDTALVNQIERFQKKFGDKVQVIAIVKPGTNRLAVRSAISKVMDSGMIVTEGIASRKENSSQRESVMEWISEKRRISAESEQNEVGSKYFISEDGRLYVMLGADVSFDSPLMMSIVNARVAKAIYQEDPSLSPEQINEAKPGINQKQVSN
ncbi:MULTISPECIES: thioredoxin domain-containing protein [Niastella]|uniref:DUF4252 domain-containing protein n=1 Tax=Niastella soli TaxID=2821487 RepID=A0ABS3Z5H9_9BACT|nr:hypothetical protein [Niastella soli]MBO9205409.1 hypothetical protein [Niastella soli]